MIVIAVFLSGCSVLGDDAEVYEGWYAGYDFADNPREEFLFDPCASQGPWVIRRDDPEAQPLRDQFEELAAEVARDMVFLQIVYAQVRGEVEEREDSLPLLDVEEVLEVRFLEEVECRQPGQHSD